LIFSLSYILFKYLAGPGDELSFSFSNFGAFEKLGCSSIFSIICSIFVGVIKSFVDKIF